MTPTEHPAKTPSAKTGLFATLRGLLHARGSGAPSGRRPKLLLGAAAAVLATLVLDVSLASAAAPTVDSTSAANVTSTSADIRAQINPNGADTTYHFGYGTADCSGNPCTSIPSPDAEIGFGTSDVAVSAHLTGLSPNTTFHYRVVADNGIGGPVAGPDHTFTTQPPGGPFTLPDGRAYEMVSPLNKNGADVGGPLPQSLNPVPKQSSPDGSAVTYGSLAAFNDPQGSPAVSQYLSVRGSNGWSTQNITPPEAASTSDAPIADPLWAFSADLSIGAVVQGDPPLAPGALPGHRNLYLRDNASGSYTALTTLTPPTPPPSGSYCVGYGGASADFQHVIFMAATQLTPNAPDPSNGPNLYEWTGGQPRLVNVLPDGTPAPPGGFIGFGASGDCESGGPHIYRAISTDGSRIFWTLDTTEQLFVRENGTSTAQVDASHGPGPSGRGVYQTASTDGAKALFIDPGALTNDASGSNDLYEYDVVSGQLNDLTPASTLLTSSAAGVQGVVGASNDLSYIYFVATGDLGSGAVPGENNLYLWHNGAITYINTLSQDDQDDWASDGTVFQSARVTPDGQHLAFTSVQSLTGYDNTLASGGICPSQQNSGNSVPQCSEVFLYDAGTNQLACASCNPTGAQPIGAATIPGGPTATYLSRALSDDGTRLFFTSRDALAARDTNGKQDVYEYEGGNVHLISTGTSGEDSYFHDASSSGNDVFFATREQLVAGDADPSRDLYDARVGGGFPAPTTPPPCSGDSCKPPASGAPTDLTLGSSSFNGPGNPSPNHRHPKHCGKGKVLKHGKCVKKHHHKRSRRDRAANHNRRAGK